MIGNLILVCGSLLALWLLNRDHITAISIKPSVQRLKELLIGIVFMAICCTINLLGQAYFTGSTFVLNQEYSWSQAWTAIWWTINATLFEELIFRGAILYLLIRKIGLIKACILSSIAFGIYHWFSYGMIGRGLVPMAYVFLLTGAGGWLFAYAFAKTRSMYASFGLHFGWIVMSIVVFSSGPLGNSLLVPEGGGKDLGGWMNLLFFLWQTIVVPGLGTWYLIRKYPVRN